MTPTRALRTAFAAGILVAAAGAASFDPLVAGEHGFFLRIGAPQIELGQSASSANPVPEPGTLAILGIGLAGLGVIGRRRG